MTRVPFPMSQESPSMELPRISLVTVHLPVVRLIAIVLHGAAKQPLLCRNAVEVNVSGKKSEWQRGRNFI